MPRLLLVGRKKKATLGPIAEMPDQAVWMAAVRDPEGNIIELKSEVR